MPLGAGVRLEKDGVDEGWAVPGDVGLEPVGVPWDAEGVVVERELGDAVPLLVLGEAGLVPEDEGALEGP